MSYVAPLIIGGALLATGGFVYFSMRKRSASFQERYDAVMGDSFRESGNSVVDNKNVRETLFSPSGTESVRSASELYYRPNRQTGVT